MQIFVTPIRRLVSIAATAVGAVLFVAGAVHAQAVAPGAKNPIPAANGGSSLLVGAPRWVDLNPVQQVSLKPLSSTWDSLSEGHRRKWIALAQNYPSLGAPEQEKLHARMVDWASLSPKERELARLNFAQTKKLTPSDRTATWDAYQSLSAEEREKLAASAQRKPTGAAVAIKPVAPERLTPVPTIKKSMDTKQALVANPGTLNRQTLLPDPLNNEVNGGNKP